VCFGLAVLCFGDALADLRYVISSGLPQKVALELDTG